MSTPPTPIMGQPQQSPQQGGPGISQQLMQAAQGAMNNPLGQAVPQMGGGGIDSGIHPVLAKIIQALAGGAQSFGWTAMQPDERLKRTELNQQKAETMARLAQTGEYEAGRIGIGQTNAATAGQNADTRQAAQQETVAKDAWMKKNAEDRTSILQDQTVWRKNIAEGRLGVAQQAIDQRATQFEQKLALAQKQYGLDAAKVELMGEGMGIKQGMLDLAKSALSQRGTIEGAQTAQKIQQFKIEHPIMSSIMDMSDLDALVGGAQGAGLPGVSQPSAAPTTGAPAQPARPSASLKKPASGGGITHKWNPQTGSIEPAGQR